MKRFGVILLFTAAILVLLVLFARGGLMGLWAAWRGSGGNG